MALMSDHYLEQNVLLHKTGKYGKWGWRNAEAVDEIAALYHAHRGIDFGAGQGTLSKAVKNVHLTNYDPAVKRYGKFPKPAAFLVCTDVLEHVEPNYLDNVLSEMKGLMLVVGYFVIATTPDGTKTLPDGRDPHLIVKPPEWWKEKLEDYFTVVNSSVGERQEAIFVLEPKG